MKYKDKQYEITDDGKLHISLQKVCEIFNYSPDTIENRVKAGMPKVRNGWFDFVAIYDWMVGKRHNSDNFTEADKLNADVKLKKAKEELAQIEIAVKNGELVEMSTVAATLEREFSKLKISMLLIGDNVMAKVVLQYPELAVQVRSLINDGIRKGLEELARSGGNIKPAETSRPRKKAGRPRKVNK